MSLAIDVDRITHVLLADGWHKVVGRSFDLDSYEYIQKSDEHEPGEHQSQPIPLLRGGAVAGIPSTGACWNEAGDIRLSCPLTAILAVKEKR
jgi:hypothetical protein